jgi:aminoglycoside N3'-acetyltransferase
MSTIQKFIKKVIKEDIDSLNLKKGQVIYVEQKNPSLKDILGSRNDFLDNAHFYQHRSGTIIAGIESFNKVLNKKDADKLQRIIRDNEDKILDYFGGGSYIEINTYINESIENA